MKNEEDLFPNGHCISITRQIGIGEYKIKRFNIKCILNGGVEFVGTCVYIYFSIFTSGQAHTYQLNPSCNPTHIFSWHSILIFRINVCF